MPRTVANQRTVYVHRERATSDFLGIKNANWQAAARDLGAHALLLYMYFASNADGYALALSPAAIRQAVGMPPQTYRDQFLKLLDKGYLVDKGHNHYEFHERPQNVTRDDESHTDYGLSFENNTFCVAEKTQDVQKRTANSREININNINNTINRQQEKQASPADVFVF